MDFPPVDPPLTDAERAQLIVALTEMMGFTVTVSTRDASVQVKARSPEFTVTIDTDGTDAASVLAAVQEMATRIAHVIEPVPAPESNTPC